MVNYKFLPINAIKHKYQLRGVISTLNACSHYHLGSNNNNNNNN